MIYTYQPRGVCSRKITIEIEDGIVKNCAFQGGCNGNTQGICSLVKGMPVEEVIARLEGLDCNGRGTSCPDQLAKALKKASQEACL
ncbi:MAG: TIGR03905 family TSCPD domain-containing protein [Oscillospiraceae bacterium]|nr:TIGR03905 family TSCPD domain-containing protein [Oscillospiraceae bacterium]